MYILTNIEAAEELERIAAVCKTTKLSIACIMGANALRAEMMDNKNKLLHDCMTCRHADRMPGVYPCSQCEQRYSDVPSKWEPKEVEA